MGTPRRTLVLVGATVEASDVTHYGGVLTLSRSLVEYAGRDGLDVKVVNTLRPGFEALSFWQRTQAGVGRIFQLIALLRAETAAGAVLFSGAGWSFYERILLSAICRMFRVSSVLFIVDGWFLNTPTTSRFNQMMVRWMLKVPTRLAASGSNWVTLFTSLGVRSDRVVTIHYWIPKSARPADVVVGPPQGEPMRFLFIGWMIREKGVEEILSALAMLFAEHHRLRFTFIGGGTLLESVRQSVKAAHWEASVVALGWVSPDELERELSAAHVFVLPSYAEGFPMALIEAMSKGLPAICTDVGGISDSVRSGVNGFLIAPRNVQALKEAMEYYLRHPEAIATHSRAALEMARVNHDPDANCRQLLDSIAATG